MKVTVAAVGRLKAGPERDLFERFLERAGRAGRPLGLSFDLREIGESPAREPLVRKAAEALGLRDALAAGTVVVVLDEGGRNLGSRALADAIAGWRDSGVRETAFVVGGPEGLAADFMDAADLRLAFGKATWPHQLVRVMLAEQLYRVVTILAGHPYHRD